MGDIADMVQMAQRFLELGNLNSEEYQALPQEIKDEFAIFIQREVFPKIDKEWRKFEFTKDKYTLSFSGRLVEEDPMVVNAQMSTYHFTDQSLFDQPISAKQAVELDRGVQPDRWRGKKKGKVRRDWQR